MTNNREYQYTNINSATTTQIFTGRGLLQAITINNDSTSTIIVIDNDSGITPPLATIQAGALPGTYWYNCGISRGLRIITSGVGDITCTWAQG